MRIELLITSVGNFGKKGFYNTQEIGLAKQLDKFFDEVIVYKAISLSEKPSINLIEGCKHSTLYQIPVKSYGINGIWDCNVMDPTTDVLIYFSDTQLSVPNVYKWCRSNGIQMYPYIGVIESHSNSKLNKFIINVMFKRNIAIYKNCTCFVKTPTVEKELAGLGIENTVLLPVGLDVSLLHSDYECTSANDVKKKYGYSEADKVLLFIGRLIEEKQPIRMLEILSEIRKKDQSYKLLMVGSGELENIVNDKIKELELENHVQKIERIPNNNIWELYRLADTFVNLNKHEIFGMAILEAMYYGCKVVAWDAPGPRFIIENGISGYLGESNEEICNLILDSNLTKSEAHRRVIENFVWESIAKRMFIFLHNKSNVNLLDTNEHLLDR